MWSKNLQPLPSKTHEMLLKSFYIWKQVTAKLKCTFFRIIRFCLNKYSGFTVCKAKLCKISVVKSDQPVKPYIITYLNDKAVLMLLLTVMLNSVTSMAGFCLYLFILQSLCLLVVKMPNAVMHLCVSWWKLFVPLIIRMVLKGSTG